MKTGRKKAKEKEDNTQKEKALELAKEKAVFFYDQFEDAYAIVKENGKNEVYKVKSKKFKNWLSYQYYKEYGEGISSETASVVKNTLEGYTIFEGKQKQLHVRVGFRNGALYYDLKNGHKAVKITKDGWSIEEAPIMFKRFNHQNSQVKPKNSNNAKIEDIFKLLNPSLNRDQRLLFKVQLISNFIPGFPHPIHCPYGPQGSAKTFMHKLMREFIDPSELETLQYTTDLKELTQKVSHHWFPPFDNISTLTKKVSDFFCRAVTGQGFSKRELYTDDRDVIYKFKRPIALNGINTVPQKPDLLDRTILYPLKTIPKNKRKTEEELSKKLRKMKPGILAEIFDIISEAMKEKEKINLTWKPRMADFSEWGEAIARSLGYPKGEFLRVYQENIGELNVEALEAHIIGRPLIELIDDRGGRIEESPQALLTMLNEKADEMNVNTNKKEWPGGSNWVWRRINEIKPNLEEVGITADRGKGEKRKIILERTPSISNTVNGVGTVYNLAMFYNNIVTLDSKDSKDAKKPYKGGEPKTSEKNNNKNSTFSEEEFNYENTAVKKIKEKEKIEEILYDLKQTFGSKVPKPNFRLEIKEKTSRDPDKVYEKLCSLEMILDKTNDFCEILKTRFGVYDD